MCVVRYSYSLDHLTSTNRAALGLVREPKGVIRTHEDFYDLPVQSGSIVVIHLLDTIPGTKMKGLGYKHYTFMLKFGDIFPGRKT